MSLEFLSDLQKRKLTGGSTLDMKFLNKLDTMTIRKATKHARPNVSAKTNQTVPLPKAEEEMPISNENQFLNNLNEPKRVTSSIETNAKIFKNTDSINKIIKSLRRRNSNESDEFINYHLVPNIGIKLP